MTTVTPSEDAPPPIIVDGLKDKLIALLLDVEGPGPHGALEGGESRDGVMTMPWWDRASHLATLRHVFADHRVWYSFDWPTWSQTEEAKPLFGSRDAIAAADLLTIRRLVTAHLRKERFCDGHLVSVAERGHLAAIVRRLTELLP